VTPCNTIEERVRLGQHRGRAPGWTAHSIGLDQADENLLIQRAEGSIRDAIARGAVGRVYFGLDLDSGQIKVGWTSNLPRRIRALTHRTRARFAWFRSVPGDRGTENSVHVALCFHRNCGEWFAACRRALDITERLIAAAALQGTAA